MMMRYVLPALALTLMPTAASAQIVQNGSFENPFVSDSCCNTVPGGTLPGWTLVSGDVNVVNGTFGSSPTGTNLTPWGNQYLDLIGQSGSGSISQSLTTVVGQAYQFSFNYSHNIFGNLPAASASYSVGGLSGLVTHSTGSRSNLDWKGFTGTFTANSGSTLLTFTNVSGGQSDGLLLDNVVVSAVPEPAAWAMMLFGFGAIGFAMRRKKVIGAVTQVA